MSLSGALSNALSGLTASARHSSVVASNISNAMTEGYARRTQEVHARASGTWGGVEIGGVTRHVDRGLVADTRDANSAMQHADAVTVFQRRMEDLLGTPEDGSSLSGRLTTFESAMIAAASRPDLTERLTTVLYAAEDVAKTIKDIGDGIQQIRQDADTEIATATTRMNTLLEEMRSLNEGINRARLTGGNSAPLEDHRQAALDELSDYIPIIEVARDNGQIALFSAGGAILLDGNSAVEFGFSRTTTITANMTQSASLLSGLTINGVAVDTADDRSPIAGGRLAALFEVRDELAEGAQARIDSVARDLVERFQDPTLDPTLLAGDAGLFTDNGAAFAATNEVGLASRLTINAAVDPDQGGATWRLRDGLNATVQGPVSDATLLQDMLAALNEKRTPASGPFTTSGISAPNLASSIMSLTGTERNLSEQSLAFATTREAELKARLLSDGVDTDEEMQRLLLIEQTYAANARLVQTVEDLLDILMRI
ncbi:flagellar hook-associated protein FlgK [Oceanicola sp. S124]|uniref:flagellar hook-associated protein FlgK n=1 Tax=Oceanicola sp. S124 TaxID=1042378 RepID=UPI0002557A88|nr:flagellar hook-associated protein FlgK [Oceanicola sp. S124]